MIVNPVRARRFGIRLTSWASTNALKIMGIKVRVVGQRPSEPCLMVSNHLSYVDILIFSSLFSSVFITSVETQEDPFLGLMSKLGGSHFVERRTKSRLLEDLKQISHTIEQNFNVTLYPEGTTGDGQKVLPFKNSLFEVAVKNKKTVQPMCINYLKINNEAVTTRNKDLIFYYGDASFGSHFKRLISDLSNAEAEVQFLNPISTQTHTDRKTVSDLSRDQIEKAYVRIV